MADKTTPTHEPVTLPATGYIRISTLVKIIPFSASTIWRKVKKGTFPQPEKLSENITGWKVEDIRAFLDSDKTKAV